MALLPLYAYIVAFSHAAKNDVYIPRAPSAGPEDFDCPMRQLALEFAMSTQPFLAQDKLQEIADALNGAQEAVNRSCVTVPKDWPIKETLPPSWAHLSDPSDDTPSIYVDFTRGDDANDGSIAHPLQHLDFAVRFARKHFGPSTPKRIVLRAGRHYLRRTVNFTSEDNDLTLTNFDAELVELSGAQPIKCDWQHMGGNDSWKVLPNTDGIWGGPPSPGQNSSVDLYLGQAATFADCQALVLPVYKQLNLGAFTWQSSDAGAWSNVCYGIVGGNYKTNQQSNAMTGVLVNGANMYSCKVTDDSITAIDGLRVNGTRAIRARYPNGNPEVYPCGFCSSLKAKSWLAPTCEQKPTMEYWPDEPLRNDTPDGWFQKYQLGVGGCCDGFTPNAGYWCGNHTQGGGAFTYLIPSGLTYDAATLPNAPYANPKGAVIQTWRPGHWSSWMFEVDDENYDAASGTIKFSKGGFQGARGNKAGDEFYVENVFEELDSANEWFFNATSRMLYFIANDSAPANLVFEATNLRVLLNYTGTMAKPVENQVIRGMTLRDTRTTYLDPHGMPSGGDWGLERTGAIYLDGVKGVQISENVLTRLDGNAISVNRYAREVVIERNEIVWNGDNAVSMWGDTQDIAFADGTTMGYDGTNGNQPRGVQFVQNLVHEIGIWEKQSSMWFQAKSCSNVLDSNIFYNGPRAGINFNDGFGGNSTLKKNLLFNTCRESGDHGPFNSWDRQVYVTAVKNGTPSVIKEWDEITQNMMVANYNGQEGVDNDDGSAYYHTHGNFFVYSGNGMKNDFGGHDNHHYNNVYGYIGNCFKIVGQIEGHEDAFYNNTCVLSSAQTQYGSFDCNAQSAENSWPKLGDNTVYMATGDPSKVGLCGMTEAAFQKANVDVDDGTVIKGPPDNAQIIAAAKTLLLG